MSTTNHLQIALDFVNAVQNRSDDNVLARFYHPDAEQTEFPNAITRNVTTRNLQALQEASARGRQLLQKETYQIIKTHVAGEIVILEIVWTAVLAIAVGKLPVGGEMKAYFAQVFEFKDGKIYRQRNYDCFEPFN